MKKAVFLPLLVLVLLAAALPLASATETVEIQVDNGRKPYRNVAFYYVYGDHIDWWQGGAKFILGTDTPEYKVIEEFMLALPSKLGIKVLAGEIYLVEGYVRAKYIFDGIIQFKDFMFIDRGGIVIVEWEYGTGLNVTIYSKVTINMSASRVSGYGFADWKRRVIRHVEICDPILGCRIQPIYDSTPTAQIPVGSQVLVIPVEGVVLEEDYRGYTHYLGGGPNLGVADTNKNIKAGMIFWDREPDYWLTYNGEGLVNIWRVDNWFNRAVLIWPTPHEVAVAKARD